MFISFYSLIYLLNTKLGPEKWPDPQPLPQKKLFILIIAIFVIAYFMIHGRYRSKLESKVGHPNS